MFYTITVHKTTLLRWSWPSTHNPLMKLRRVKHRRSTLSRFSQLPGNCKERDFPALKRLWGALGERDVVKLHTFCRKLTLKCVYFVKVSLVSYVFLPFLSLRFHLEIAWCKVELLCLAAVTYSSERSWMNSLKGQKKQKRVSQWGKICFLHNNSWLSSRMNALQKNETKTVKQCKTLQQVRFTWDGNFFFSEILF